MNKEFELAEKVPQKELRNSKKHNNGKRLAYVAISKKKRRKTELFTEIIKNLKELENNDKSKNY